MPNAFYRLQQTPVGLEGTKKADVPQLTIADLCLGAAPIDEAHDLSFVELAP